MTRFSRRVAGIEVSGIRKWFEGAGPGAINLGLGQPDLDTPTHIKAAACRAIEEGRTGYTPNGGIPELQEAIAAKSRRENGLEFSPGQVIVTAGASEALHIAMQALVDDGDRVLVADPGFVSYAALASIAGGRPEGLRLDDRFHIDVEAAKERMDGAKVLVLNSPANPTGAVEPADSVRALAEYADDAGVTILSDEVYEHFVYDGARMTSPGRFGENVVTINATSKTYAMTGWRLGWLAGPDEVVAQAVKVHQYCQACATSIVVALRVGRPLVTVGCALLVLLIGLSRLVLGVHYPIDVIGGYLIGLALLAGFVLAWPKAVQTARRHPLRRVALAALLLSLVAVAASALVAASIGPWSPDTAWTGPIAGLDPVSIEYTLIAAGFGLGLVLGTGADRGCRVFRSLPAGLVATLVGLIVLALLWFGAALLLPDQGVVAALGVYLRSAAVGAWCIAGAPQLFCRLGLYAGSDDA